MLLLLASKKTRPNSLFWLLLLLSSLALSSPTMVFEVDGVPSSSPFTCAKAFTRMGPDVHYELEFSSRSLNASVVFIDPSSTDTTTNTGCQECCAVFSTSSGSLPHLSPETSALISGRSVLMRFIDVIQCPGATNMGLESVFVQLERAGAKALIMVTQHQEPGMLSSIVGPGDFTPDHVSARSSSVPYVAIGSAAGKRLIEEARASSLASSPSHDVHVAFVYDQNRFHFVYTSYYKAPFKIISILVVVCILLRCFNLSLRLCPITKLPLLNSTKNLVVMMALLTAVSIMLMITFNGVAAFEEGSKGWVIFTVGRMMPFVNISSTVLVSRIWSVRQGSPQGSPQVSPQVSSQLPSQESPSSAGERTSSAVCHASAARNVPAIGNAVAALGSATGNEIGSVSSQSSTLSTSFSSDPAKSQPTRTLLIVFAGLAADATYMFVVIYSQASPITVARTAFLLVAIGNFLILAFFFYSGIQVLRSLSSSNKSLKSMASYLLIMAAFTLMIVSSFFMVSKEFVPD